MRWNTSSHTTTITSPRRTFPARTHILRRTRQTNDEIDKLRHSATAALFERQVMSLLSRAFPAFTAWATLSTITIWLFPCDPGMIKDRDEVAAKLVEIQYDRNDIGFARNKFRIRGDVLDVFPSDSSTHAVRIEFFGDEIERICDFNPITGELVAERNHVAIYPASHYVTTMEKREAAIGSIQAELAERLAELKAENEIN